MNEHEFCERLLHEERVAFIPGSVFTTSRNRYALGNRQPMARRIHDLPSLPRRALSTLAFLLLVAVLCPPFDLEYHRPFLRGLPFLGLSAILCLSLLYGCFLFCLFI